MTLQEIFTKVATHLLKQAQKSILPGIDRCAYRGAGGLACAVGCLIPDELYSAELEGRYVAHIQPVLVQAGVLKSYGTESELGLLIKLQDLHDNENPEHWYDNLADLALQFGLEMPA